MKKNSMYIILFCLFYLSCSTMQNEPEKSPVEYVNPYMGNISHLLVPTFPTVHLPNSILRVYPERKDFTSDLIAGLPVIVTSHRGSSAFNISPKNEFWGAFEPVINYTYDNEKIAPYRYSVYLNEAKVQVDFAPSHQSGVYNFQFEEGLANQLIINTRNGKLKTAGNGISGYQLVGQGPTKVYLYLEAEQPLSYAGTLNNNEINFQQTEVEGKNKALVLCFQQMRVNIRYGISFISEEQAKKNLEREIRTYSVNKIAETGKKKWNDVLSKIQIGGGSENDKTVFYTSLYRTYERMINISEDEKYYSAFDDQIHDDGGSPFYTDDWVWDTYRATHPLRTLIEPDMESNMIHSYIRMSRQTKEGWMPTFPEITGDSHRMNGNHAVVVVWDAYSKGIRGYDLEAAYNACKGALTEKSLLPWQRIPNTELDVFYREQGYFPALYPDEEEDVKEVNSREKRQPVAVTLGTCYDDWCLAQIAKELGKTDDYRYFLKRSYNYRNVYNAETAFFHPKDKQGKFIEPFDYRFSGGQGARNYYDENNAWTYRWDVPHNLADLIRLMGSPENFVRNLDQTFREPLGTGKFVFYAQLPDQTGNVGQFSMANEPSFHIPYLYNYAGQPWKTQKRIRDLLNQWFRNDLMGVPGDEDGGGMSAFVVFSAMGFYPVTPGSATYNIGSPLFESIKINLGNNRLHRKFSKIMVNGMKLPEIYGKDAVSRGDDRTRLITLKNLAWTSKEFTIKLDGEIGLTKGKQVKARLFHPVERLLGSYKYGDSLTVSVPPFRSLLLFVSSGNEYQESGVSGVDFEIVKNVPGQPLIIRLLGLPGTENRIRLDNIPGVKTIEIDGENASELENGESMFIRFEGEKLKEPYHRKIKEMQHSKIPEDAPALYEATVFAADNNALEVRSLFRSGKTAIPQVKTARDAFFNQPAFVNRGIWDKQLFDGKMNTGFWASRRHGDIRIRGGCFRLDLGETIFVDSIIFKVNNEYELQPLLIDEGNFAQISSNLKNWKSVSFLAGTTMTVPVGEKMQYLKMNPFPDAIAEIEVYSEGKKVLPEKFRANNLFADSNVMKCADAWSASFRLNEIPKNSSLSVAINGEHGIEGAYAALKVNGEYVGASSRAVSYPANPWENGTVKADSNYTYFFPLTENMKNREIEVFVLGYNNNKSDFIPDICILAYPAPYEEKIMIVTYE